MSNAQTVTVKTGVPITWVIAIVLGILKLTGVIGMSWFWIAFIALLGPIITLAILAVTGLLFVLAFVGACIGILGERFINTMAKRRRKRLGRENEK